VQLQHEFTVPVEPATAWDVLLDVEAIAPCMPGATLGEVTGDEFTGTVKVKVGPVSLTYAGAARFTTKDDAARRVVIEAAGKDRRGGGTASATVTATLHEEGPPEEGLHSTRVVVDTDLAVSGKPAQFGRGMLADVGGKLIGQFADCLAAKIAAGEVGPAGAGAGPPAGGAAADQAGPAADPASEPSADLAGQPTADSAVQPAADPAVQPAADPAVQPAAEPPAEPAGPRVAEQPAASDGQVRVSRPASTPASTIRAAQEIDLLAVGLIPKWAGYAAAGLAGLLVGIVVDRLVRRG